MGITAPSHAVIHNLLAEVVKQAGTNRRSLRIGQRADKGNPYLHVQAKNPQYKGACSRPYRMVNSTSLPGPDGCGRERSFASSVDTLVCR